MKTTILDDIYEVMNFTKYVAYGQVQGEANLFSFFEFDKGRGSPTKSAYNKQYQQYGLGVILQYCIPVEKSKQTYFYCVLFMKWNSK